MVADMQRSSSVWSEITPGIVSVVSTDNIDFLLCTVETKLGVIMELPYR